MSPVQATTVVLSRHGETVWHAENRYAGSSDVDLTPAGQRQADVLSSWARRTKPDALYSSPVRRARETVAPVASALGMTAVIVDDLREVHFGFAEGRTMKEIISSHPDIAAQFLEDPVTGHFPDAEPPSAAAARGRVALQTIAGTHPGKTVLVVAHSTFYRLTLCSLLGIPLQRYRQAMPRLDTGTLTTISLTGNPGDPAGLLSFNVPLEVAAVPA